MKNIAVRLVIILFILTGMYCPLFAQAPEGIIYQAEARNDKGKILENQFLEIEIFIMEDSDAGFTVWRGLHSVITSDFGIFVLIIGNGSNTTGEIFEEINWGGHSHFLNVKVKDPKTLMWVDMGTTQLLSVPYALHSKTAQEALTADYTKLYNVPTNVSQFVNDAGYISDNPDPDPENELITGAVLNGTNLEITDAGGTFGVDLGGFSSLWNTSGPDIFFNSGRVGIGTSNPEDILHVTGGNVRIGDVSDDDGSLPGYGDRLYFSGGDDWPGWDSENSDQLWMARFNADDNVSELRVGIGDDNWGYDKFVVGIEGYDGTGWEPIMSVLGAGNVGIGTTIPSKPLHILKDNDPFPLKIESTTGSTGIQLTTSSTVASIGTQYTTGDGDQWYNYAYQDHFTFRVQEDNKHVLTLKKTGNVGIGAFNPLTRLQVDGNITFAPAGLTANESRFIGQSIASQSIFDAYNGFGGMEIENIEVGESDDSEQQIHFWTHDQGVESQRRMTIDINGKVGIGTTNPEEKLHVAGNMRLEGTFGDEYGNVGSPGQILSSNGNGTEWIAASSGSDDNDWTLSGSDMYSAVTGNVGIGTMSPVSKLEIVADSDNTPFRITRLDDSNLHAEFEVDANGNLAFHPSGGIVFLVNDNIHMWGEDQESMTNVFSVDGDSYFNSGNLGVGTTSPSAKLTIAEIGESNNFGESALYINSGNKYFDYNAGLTFRGTGNYWATHFTSTSDMNDDGEIVGIYKEESEAGNLGEIIATFRNDGKVGIGTTNPGEKLHVAGNMRLDGTFGDEYGNAGSAGQLLSSTGTGTEWIAAPIGGGDFSNGGEAGGADRTLGNTDDYSLGLKTNNTTRFNILNDGGIRIDGNLGIFTDPDDVSSINQSIRLHASKTYSNSILKLSGHNSGTIYLESRRSGFTPETSGKTWTIASGSGSVLDLDKFYIYNPDDGYCFTIRDGGNIGIGTQSPKSKLQVNGGVQIANDSDAASADKVGTLRYRADSNNSYVEMCMQTGASSYEWVVVKHNTW